MSSRDESKRGFGSGSGIPRGHPGQSCMLPMLTAPHRANSDGIAVFYLSRATPVSVSTQSITGLPAGVAVRAEGQTFVGSFNPRRSPR
jgi:hypothetical protein